MIPLAQTLDKNFDLERTWDYIFTMDTTSFIERAREVHGDTYLYERVAYTPVKYCRVIITCPIHGDFEQRASSHLSGNGCKQCSDAKRRMTTDDFIKKAKEVHGDRFDYSMTDYKRSHGKVTIICAIHGKYEQKAYRHIQGDGCRACKYLHHPGGYTYNLFKENRELARSTGIFYIVEYEFPGEQPFIKVGITIHNAYTRHKSHWKRVTILQETVMAMEDAFHHEQLLLHRPDIQQFRYEPRNLNGGVTECFTLGVKPFLF
jgi:hypothetical protein